jgi:hypothetical protein
MKEYPDGSVEDRTSLAKLPAEKLLDHLFLQVRNTWRVDGLYFLEIEKRFGTEAATQIDAEVWSGMAAIEAKALGRGFGLDENPDARTIVRLLGKSSWALDQPFKTVESNRNHATLSINRCRTQEARRGKGFGEFPCKRVRLGYLEKFAQALNPEVEVSCLFCPPDKRPEGSWCKWEFKQREADS